MPPVVPAIVSGIGLHQIFACAFRDARPECLVYGGSKAIHTTGSTLPTARSNGVEVVGHLSLNDLADLLAFLGDRKAQESLRTTSGRPSPRYARLKISLE